MSSPSSRVVAAVAGAALLPSGHALAHGFAGDRFFPATIQTDDPFVADEATAGTLTKNPDNPAGGQSYSYEFDISKRIMRKLDFTAAYQWNYFQPKNQAAHYGFGTLTIGQQYQLFIDNTHEAMALIGLQESLGHTGAVNHGGADDHHDARADLRFRQRLRRSAGIPALSPTLRDHRQSQRRLPDPRQQQRGAQPERLQRRLRDRIQPRIPAAPCAGRRHDLVRSITSSRLSRSPARRRSTAAAWQARRTATALRRQASLRRA